MSHVVRGRTRFVIGALVAVALAGGCDGDGAGAKYDETHEPLTAVCLDLDAVARPGTWICGEPATLECVSHGRAYPDFIYVLDAPASTCAGASLTVEPGPFPVGSHTLAVSAFTDDGPDRILCSSVLVVRDTLPPVVTPRVVDLWPPNHEVHRITPADCLAVQDACDETPRVWLTWASSDEADDATGDGSTLDDIANLGCDGVELRAERAGGGDGRVYTLGWRAEDAAGNHVEGTCRVVVPHDQSGGGAADSGEDHRVPRRAGNCP